MLPERARARRERGRQIARSPSRCLTRVNARRPRQSPRQATLLQPTSDRQNRGSWRSGPDGDTRCGRRRSGSRRQRGEAIAATGPAWSDTKPYRVRTDCYRLAEPGAKPCGTRDSISDDNGSAPIFRSPSLPWLRDGLMKAAGCIPRYKACYKGGVQNRVTPATFEARGETAAPRGEQVTATAGDRPCAHGQAVVRGPGGLR